MFCLYAIDISGEVITGFEFNLKDARAFAFRSILDFMSCQAHKMAHFFFSRWFDIKNNKNLKVLIDSISGINL